MSWRRCRRPRPPASALTGRCTQAKPLVQRPHSPKVHLVCPTSQLHERGSHWRQEEEKQGGGGGNKGASPQPPLLGQVSRLAGLLEQRLLYRVPVGQRHSNPLLQLS